MGRSEFSTIALDLGFTDRLGDWSSCRAVSPPKELLAAARRAGVAHMCVPSATGCSLQQLHICMGCRHPRPWALDEACAWHHAIPIAPHTQA